MALILEQINAKGLAPLSYRVGDDQSRVAAVIDPHRDVHIYLQRARELGIRITHVLETHLPPSQPPLLKLEQKNGR
jgi:hydroxyacylglutathione hydrolase